MNVLLARRSQVAKHIYLEEHGIKYTTHLPKEGQELIRKFDGTTIEEMMESAANHKLNINIFAYDEDKHVYSLDRQWRNNDNNSKVHNTLLYTKDNVCHIMYVKDAEKLTKLMFCDKCGSFCVRYDDKGNHYKVMANHKKHCDGKFKKDYVPEPVSMPYIPHIQTNPIYEYCLAHGLQWKPFDLYMTYDFETMESSVNESKTSSITINSHLIPLSVAFAVKFKGDIVTHSFDARDPNFIPHWIKSMFDNAKLLVNDKIEFYKSLLNIKVGNKVPELSSVVKDLNTISVFGFNSSRFDTNLFKEYVNYKYEGIKWYFDID